MLEPRSTTATIVLAFSTRKPLPTLLLSFLRLAGTTKHRKQKKQTNLWSRRSPPHCRWIFIPSALVELERVRYPLGFFIPQEGPCNSLLASHEDIQWASCQQERSLRIASGVFFRDSYVSMLFFTFGERESISGQACLGREKPLHFHGYCCQEGRIFPLSKGEGQGIC